MFDGKLNKFCKDVNQVVRKKGFWDSMEKSLNSITFQSAYIDTDEEEEIVDLCYKATKDAFISQKVGLIAGEAFEAVEAMRKNNYGLEKKDSFEDELADIFIRLADLCGELNIDIEKQIEWKLAYNDSRPNKHGKEF